MSAIAGRLFLRRVTNEATHVSVLGQDKSTFFGARSLGLDETTLELKSDVFSLSLVCV